MQAADLQNCRIWTLSTGGQLASLLEGKREPGQATNEPAVKAVLGLMYCAMIWLTVAVLQLLLHTKRIWHFQLWCALA